MNIDQLKATVKSACESQGGANFYLLIKTQNDGEEIYEAKKANMTDDTVEGVLSLYRRYLVETIVETEDKTLISLSSADDRINAIYEYDLDEAPIELNVTMNTNLDETHDFNFQEDSLANLVGYIVKIGTSDDNILLFKKHYSINLIKSKNGMLARKHNQLEQFDGEILRINGTIDFMKIEDKVYVISLKELEKFCKFHDIIKKEAQKGIKTIEDTGLLETIEPLADELDRVSFSRKLTKVTKNSIVLNLDLSKVIDFAKLHYPNIKQNTDGTKLRLDSKKSKNEFLKLLNDDLLKSELTGLEYNSVAKDAISE